MKPSFAATLAILEKAFAEAADHDQFCVVGPDPVNLQGIVAGFIRVGLDMGDQVGMWRVPNADPGWSAVLPSQGIALEAALRAGTLTRLEGGEENHLAPLERATSLLDRLAQAMGPAQSQTPRRFRLIGDLASLGTPPQAEDSFHAALQRLDQFCTTHRVIALWLADLDRLAPELAQIALTIPGQIIVQGLPCPNLFQLAPVERASPRNPRVVLQGMLRGMRNLEQQRKQWQQSLEDRDRLNQLLTLEVQERKRIESDLQRNLEQRKALQALLPICSQCHRIRDHRGRWHAVESFLSDQLDARLSHGFCPECSKKLFPG
jgi:hypothetical protein